MRVRCEVEMRSNRGDPDDIKEIIKSCILGVLNYAGILRVEIVEFVALYKYPDKFMDDLVFDVELSPVEIVEPLVNYELILRDISRQWDDIVKALKGVNYG